MLQKLADFKFECKYKFECAWLATFYAKVVAEIEIPKFIFEEIITKTNNIHISVRNFLYSI